MKILEVIGEDKYINQLDSDIEIEPSLTMPPSFKRCERLSLKRFSTEINCAIAFLSDGLSETQPIQKTTTSTTPIIRLKILLFINNIYLQLKAYEFKTLKFHSIHQILVLMIQQFHPLLQEI